MSVRSSNRIVFTTSVTCVVRLTCGLARWTRSPIPVRLGVNTSCPDSRSGPRMVRNPYEPPQAPCTRTNVVMPGTLALAGAPCNGNAPKSDGTYRDVPSGRHRRPRGRCALPWAQASGVRGFRGGLHRTQCGAHVGPQPVPPGSDDLPGPARRPRGGCPQVAGARSVGEALPDPAAAAGERVDPVPPRRGRAGGVTAVIQDHPRERAGPVRLGDHAGHLVLVAIREPVVPGEPGAGLRPAGLPEPGRPDAFRAPPADLGDVGGQVPHQLRPGGDHLLGGRRQPGQLVADLAAAGAREL